MKCWPQLFQRYLGESQSLTFLEEKTSGAYDDAIRHSITKMSHFHFVAAEEYARRVIQLGENPNSVFCVGALGVDRVHCIDFMSREELERDLGLAIKSKFLITFHPVTLEFDAGISQLKALFRAVDDLNDATVIFTKSNADEAGTKFNKLILEYSIKRDSVHVYESLGQRRYLSLAKKIVDGVIGNSSSGLIEVPSLKTPTVNIGNRQAGRLLASSVVNCAATYKEISHAIRKIVSGPFQHQVQTSLNPNGSSGAANLIFEKLMEVNLTNVQQKEFYDLGN